MSRMQDLEILWFSQYFLAVGFLNFAKVRYFLRTNSQASQVFDYSFDSGGAGTFKFESIAKSNSNGCSFFSSEVGALVSVSKSFNLLQNSPIPRSSSFVFGSSLLGIKSFPVFPPPCLKARFQLNKVLRNTPKASAVDSKPCFSQWTEVLSFSFLLFR